MALINCPECGKEVSPTAVACPHCGFGVKKHFDDIELEKQKQERMKTLAIQRARRKKVLKIVIPMAILIVSLVSVLIINHIILSKRVTFSSEKEMMDFLNGYWVNGSAFEAEDYYDFLYFKNLMCEKKVNPSHRTRSAHAEEMKLHPKRGCFYVGSRKYIIIREKWRHIVNDIGVEYDRTDTAPDNKKSFVDSVDFYCEPQVNCDDEKISCTGSIINLGEETYSDIGLCFELKDKNGKIIESMPKTLYKRSNDTFDDDLSPGEIMDYDFTWRPSKNKLSRCVSYNVVITGYDVWD